MCETKLESNNVFNLLFCFIKIWFISNSYLCDNNMVIRAQSKIRKKKLQIALACFFTVAQTLFISFPLMNV